MSVISWLQQPQTWITSQTRCSKVQVNSARPITTKIKPLQDVYFRTPGMKYIPPPSLSPFPHPSCACRPPSPSYVR